MFSASRTSSGPSRASPRCPRSWPVVERHRSQWLACAHDNLDDEEFSSAWTWGEALTRAGRQLALDEEEPAHSAPAENSA
jgi:hypothetical protein